MNEQQQAALALMGEFATFAATLTGAKQQLIDQGWSPENAEQLVLHAVKGQQ